MKQRYLVDPENLISTENHFSEATRLAPKFAEAHAQISHTLNNAASLGVHERLDTFRESQARAEEALQLDPENATAWFSLANIQLHHHYNAEKAIELLKKAIVFDPGYAQAYSKLSVVYSIVGELSESGYAANRALELEPNNALLTLTLTDVYQRFLYHNRIPHGHALVRAQLRAGLALEPSYTFVHDRILESFYHEGNFQKGMAYIEEHQLDKEKDSRVWLFLIGANWKMGNRAESDRLMGEFQETIIAGNGARRYLAQAHAERGEGAEALYWLEQSREAREPFLLFTMGLIEPEQHTWSKADLSTQLDTFKASIGLKKMQPNK